MTHHTHTTDCEIKMQECTYGMCGKRTVLMRFMTWSALGVLVLSDVVFTYLVYR